MISSFLFLGGDLAETGIESSVSGGFGLTDWGLGIDLKLSIEILDNFPMDRGFRGIIGFLGACGG